MGGRTGELQGIWVILMVKELVSEVLVLPVLYKMKTTIPARQTCSPMLALMVLHRSLAGTYMCSPVFVPQMVGMALLPGAEIPKVST